MRSSTRSVPPRPALALLLALLAAAALVVPALRLSGAPPTWTSPGTGIAITPAYLVAQGILVDVGGGIYTLDRAVSVHAADTLSIGPGVTIRPTDVDVRLDCAGPVSLEGTADSPITLGGATSSWQGVSLNLGPWSTSIRHARFLNTAGTALLVANTFTDRAATFANLAFEDARGVALRLQLLEPRVRHTFRDLAMTRCGTAVMIDRSSGVTLDTLTVTAPNGTSVSINGSPTVPAAVWLAQGGAATTVRNATVAETGLWALSPSGAGPEPDSIHVLSGRFTGTGRETAIALERGAGAVVEGTTISGYAGGVYARASAGLAITATTFGTCGVAVHVAGTPRFARATPFTVGAADWLEIAQDGSQPGSWQFDASGNFRSPASSGLRFPFQGTTFETAAVFSKGHARLLASNAQYDLVKNNVSIGRQQILGAAPLATLFGLPDDLESDPDTSDQHGQGMRTFAPGTLDLNGVAAAETVTVFAWFAPTSADTVNRANRAAVHVFPDGRIRWLWRELRYTALVRSFAAGAVDAGGRLEILAAVNPLDTAVGYAWSPATPETGTRISGSVIANSTIGLRADTAVRLVLDATTVARNTTGILVNAGLETFSISSSTIASNATDIAITASAGSILAENSYLGGSYSGNTGLLVNSNPSANPLVAGPAGSLVTGTPGLCALQRLVPGSANAWTVLRALRESLLGSAPGRLLVALYHAL